MRVSVRAEFAQGRPRALLCFARGGSSPTTLFARWRCFLGGVVRFYHSALVAAEQSEPGRRRLPRCRLACTDFAGWSLLVFARFLLICLHVRVCLGVLTVLQRALPKASAMRCCLLGSVAEARCWRVDVVGIRAVTIVGARRHFSPCWISRPLRHRRNCAIRRDVCNATLLVRPLCVFRRAF